METACRFAARAARAAWVKVAGAEAARLIDFRFFCGHQHTGGCSVSSLAAHKSRSESIINILPPPRATPRGISRVGGTSKQVPGRQFSPSKQVSPAPELTLRLRVSPAYSQSEPGGGGLAKTAEHNGEGKGGSRKSCSPPLPPRGGSGAPSQRGRPRASLSPPPLLALRWFKYLNRRVRVSKFRIGVYQFRNFESACTSLS